MEDHKKNRRWVLLFAAAIASGCGLASELLLGTLASYLVGNTALSYGIATGGFLAAMGLGSYLSRFIASDGPTLLKVFVLVELAIAPATALLPLGLYATFAVDGLVWLALILATLILGTLAGLEIPLLTRLLEQEEDLKDALAGVLALDYLGALIGSLTMPLILLPWLGMLGAASAIALLPALMVVALSRLFPDLRSWGWIGLVLAALFAAGIPLVNWVGDRLESTLYDAPVITRQQSPYQRLVLTRQNQDLRLYLDNELQFSTLDEYRYHEALVHPALSLLASDRPQQPWRILLLGAGDGMALREVLKWPQVQQVLLIDLDAAVVNLAQHHPFLRRTNGDAFADHRVQVRYGDAFVAIQDLTDAYDAIIADFPDPDRPELAKLYSRTLYHHIRHHLNPGGVFVTQASSPFFASKAFTCIAKTIASIGLSPLPYQVTVPSFGPWGFILTTTQPLPATWTLPITTRFLTADILPTLFILPRDYGYNLDDPTIQINTLIEPAIVDYQNDWHWSLY
ncbi:MAG: polyamine aminopropyltransferase [Oscillatoriales cyanobacterium SM2_2_1]|nr:polyamine aminopropyltransferase [Oscillatoriales cyanobacterium SM2_2_1]